MAENYKKLYESMKYMVEVYQDKILPEWRELLEKNHLGVEDAMKVLKNHCVSIHDCEGCKFYIASITSCYFVENGIPCDWKLDGGVKDG